MKKGDGFVLFLKVFSRDTDLWVMLGDFTVKKPRKIRKGNPYLPENWLSKTEMLCVADNHKDAYHTCANGV